MQKEIVTEKEKVKESEKVEVKEEISIIEKIIQANRLGALLLQNDKIDKAVNILGKTKENV